MLLKYLSFSGLLCGLVACGGGGGSQPGTNTSKENSPIVLSSSSISSQPSSSSSSSSSYENRSPEAKVAISIQGLTVHVDGSASTDPDNDTLSYSIDYDDGSNIRYGNAWHTYTRAGNYSVRLSVSDGKLTSEKVEIVAITTADTNHPPVARMVSFGLGINNAIPQYSLTSYGTLSYDEDKDPLTYKWDSAGTVSQDKNATVTLGCNSLSGSSSSASSAISNAGVTSKPDHLITLTVSDGKVSDTSQLSLPYKNCPDTIFNTSISDDMASPNFTYRIEGLKVYLDARSSSNKTVSLHWDFGDGASEDNYWLTSHTYTQAGTYKIVLTNTTTAPAFFNMAKEIMVTVP